MTFEEVLEQAMAMLQRRGRLTYRTLQEDKNFKRHFRLAAPAARRSQLQQGVARQCAAWTCG